VIDKQRDTMIKVKKDCRFEYTLSYKTINNRSSEKKYIKTLKSLNHTHLIYLNPFSFKVHETGTVEY
jgi:adenine C2-methylase RlmN of 23S rRNA A2503 and tRNA A37